jgi:hypothetical protein
MPRGTTYVISVLDVCREDRVFTLSQQPYLLRPFLLQRRELVCYNQHKIDDEGRDAHGTARSCKDTNKRNVHVVYLSVEHGTEIVIRHHRSNFTMLLNGFVIECSIYNDLSVATNTQ